MSNYTCATHKDNPNWHCFESNGTITHIEGEIQPISMLPIEGISEEDAIELIKKFRATPVTWINKSKINVNAFIEAVRDDISIGIVEVDDSDFVQFGVIKQLAKTHLGWDENK